MPLTAIFLLQCTPALCCFSVMLHNVWHLGGMAPLALRLNPPLNHAHAVLKRLLRGLLLQRDVDSAPIDSQSTRFDSRSTAIPHQTTIESRVDYGESNSRQIVSVTAGRLGGGYSYDSTSIRRLFKVGS